MKKALCLLLALLLALPLSAAAEELALPYRMLCGRVLFAFPSLPWYAFQADTPEVNARRVWYFSTEEGGSYMVEAADVGPLLANEGSSPQDMAGRAAAMLDYAAGYFQPQSISDYQFTPDGELLTLRFTLAQDGVSWLGVGVLEGEQLVLGLFTRDALGLSLLDAVRVLPEAKAERVRAELFAPTQVAAGAAEIAFPCAPIGRERTFEEGSILRAVTWEGWLPTGEIFRFQQFETDTAFRPLTKSLAISQMKDLASSFLSPYRLRSLRGAAYDSPRRGVHRLRFQADMDFGDSFTAELCVILTAEGTAWLAWATAGDAGAAFADSLALAEPLPTDPEKN